MKTIQLLSLLLCFPTAVFGQHDFSANSTEKNRITPSQIAARFGSAVQWRPSVETAIKESAETGKPVFWYVPTVRGTFMDRKDSIDRYMLAGPFSWPELIELLNERFIPVKAAPKQSQQNEYDLKPFVFVEPGFVVLDGAGKLTGKVDRLTTFHPQWFQHLVSSFAREPFVPKSKSEKLASLWKQFEQGEYQNMKFTPLELSRQSPETVELLLLDGMVDFRLGKQSSAKLKWEAARDADPESPLAWKAAAEAEGFGPFVRGFEVHSALPNEALNAGRDSLGSAAPKGAYDEPELWKRGVEFLVGMQDEEGGWHDSDYDFGGSDSLPNVRTAVTAIAAMALLESQDRLNSDEKQAERIDSAIRRAKAYLVNVDHFNRSDRDELFWAYAYRVRFLSRWVKKHPHDLNDLQVAVNDLASIQGRNGGWFHEYPNPMVTGLALLAFAESNVAGVAANPQVLINGTESLKRDRFRNGSYSYSSRGGNASPNDAGREELIQAAGRMPLCELALFLNGASSDTLLAAAIKNSFEYSEAMMRAFKYDDHTSSYVYGGFFIWYDIETRGEAIARIKDTELADKYRAAQRELILSLPEVDGCFVDSHELGRVYGTAMALLSLARN